MSLAATVTMVMMLVLLSSLVIVLSGMQAGLSFVESKVEVRAELAEGVAQDRVDALTAQLEALPEVASVGYVSKEQALAEFDASSASRTGEPDLTEYISNPFPDQLSIKLRDPRQAGQVMSVLDAAARLGRGRRHRAADGHRQAGERHRHAARGRVRACWRWSA